jgi:hypothetical protein
MAKHLIAPHPVEDGRVPAVDYHAELIAAHDAIVARAAGWTAPKSNPRWGITAKRALVDLTDAHRFVYNNEHPIQELMNQCATVERLLDALDWAIQNGWADSVIECNPTTSAGTGSGTKAGLGESDAEEGLPEAGPPDLWTVGPKGEACFEVSDVLSPHDGNRKLPKDLARLFQVPGGKAAFLVGTDAWEGRIKNKGFWYTKVNDTIIARVDPGV